MNLVRAALGLTQRRRLLGGITTIVLGTAIAQVLVVVTSPILTRLYSPSDYGLFSVALSVLSILVTISCLRYDAAIPLPASDVEAANVLVLSIVVSLTLSVAAAVLLLLAGRQLLGLFGASGLAPFLPFLVLGQAAGGVGSALVGWAVRTKSYRSVSEARITQAAVLVALQIAFGLAKAGSGGLLIGDAISRLSGSTGLARAAWSSHRAALSAVSRSGMAAVASRYRRFPLFSAASALLATIGLQAPVLLMVAFYGATTGGRYALAARVCAIPVTLVAGAVGQVFVAEAAPLARDDAAGLRALFTRVSRNLALMALIPAILLAIGAPLGAGLLFGGDWGEAGLFVLILVPAYFVEFVAGATGDVLFVLERQDLHLVRETARFLLVGGSIPLAAALGLPGLDAVILLSVLTGTTYLVYGVISWRAVRAHRAGGAVADPPASTIPVDL